MIISEVKMFSLHYTSVAHRLSGPIKAIYKLNRTLVQIIYILLRLVDNQSFTSILKKCFKMKSMKELFETIDPYKLNGTLVQIIHILLRLVDNQSFIYILKNMLQNEKYKRTIWNNKSF